MKEKGKIFFSSFIFLSFFLFSFYLASGATLGESNSQGVILQTPDAVTFNNATAFVNNSVYLQGLTPQQVANLYTETDPLSLHLDGSTTMTGILKFDGLLNTFYDETNVYEAILGGNRYFSWGKNLNSINLAVYDSAAPQPTIKSSLLSISEDTLDFQGTIIAQSGLTIGDDTADRSITFDGETNDGLITWMEDEDYFQFSDDITAPNLCYLNGTNCNSTLYDNSYAKYQFTNNNFNGSGNITTSGFINTNNISGQANLPVDVKGRNADARSSLFRVQNNNSVKLFNVWNGWEPLGFYAWNCNSASGAGCAELTIGADYRDGTNPTTVIRIASSQLYLPATTYPGGNMIFTRLGDATSTTTQADSMSVGWQNSLWNGASASYDWYSYAYTKASKSENNVFYWALKLARGTAGNIVEAFTIRNSNGLVNITSQTGGLVIQNASVWNNFGVCYVNNGNLGHCTDAVNATGACTCTGN